MADAVCVWLAAEGHAACLSMIATLTSVREELAPVAARYQIAPIATMPGLQVAASARAAVEGALKLLPALPFPDAFAGVMGRVAASFATNTIDTTATDVDLSVTDQIKLVVQRVVKLCHKGDHDAAFFNWSQHHHHLLALSSALDVTDLVRSLGSHGQRLYAQADVIASQVQAVLRILAGVRDHLHQYNLACTSLGRSCGAILISLVTNGFCKPPPSEYVANCLTWLSYLTAVIALEPMAKNRTSRRRKRQRTGPVWAKVVVTATSVIRSRTKSNSWASNRISSTTMTIRRAIRYALW